MGKIEVKGSSSRKVAYDLMEINVSFKAKEATASAASEKVMRECEDFLNELKKAGFDVSQIKLADDALDENCSTIRDPEGGGYIEVTEYRAHRDLEIKHGFDMKMVNYIRSLLNKLEYNAKFRINYELSNANDIRQQLLLEALKEAREQAVLMAEAIGQKVVGLISADKHAPEIEHNNYADILCMFSASLDEEYVEYESSNELSATDTTLSEEIYTSWEIS